MSKRSELAAIAAEFGRKGGKVKSKRKSAAARANGKKGGRPKKQEPVNLEPMGDVTMELRDSKRRKVRLGPPSQLVRGRGTIVYKLPDLPAGKYGVTVKIGNSHLLRDALRKIKPAAVKAFADALQKVAAKQFKGTPRKGKKGKR